MTDSSSSLFGTVDPLVAPQTSRLEIGLASLGTLRWVAADIRLVLEEARRRLDLSPIASVALGRALSAAALIRRISLKTPARIVLEIIGDGPLGKVVSEADSAGHLRGLVGNPQLKTPEDGRMKIAPLLGSGVFRVTREEKRTRYSSQVELVSGELGDDTTHFLEQSEQIRSAVLLGVLPRSIGIAAAGGLIVEALPGTEESVIEQLEENIRSLEGVSNTLQQGGVASLIEAVLRGFDRETVDVQALEYRCRCSRDTLLKQILPLAQKEPESLVGDDGRCEAICAYCGARYIFEEEELTTTH